MSTSAAEIFEIANLPATPDHLQALPLLLQYDPQQQSGRFFYANQPLRMTGTISRVRISRGSRNSEQRSQNEQAGQTTIPCGWLWNWLRYGANWPTKDRFVEHGFTFDPATQTWHTQLFNRKSEAAYHDTIYTTVLIEMHFDLLNLQGRYSESDEQERID